MQGTEKGLGEVGLARKMGRASEMNNGRELGIQGGSLGQQGREKKDQEPRQRETIRTQCPSRGA